MPGPPQRRRPALWKPLFSVLFRCYTNRNRTSDSLTTWHPCVLIKIESSTRWGPHGTQTTTVTKYAAINRRSRKDEHWKPWLNLMHLYNCANDNYCVIQLISLQDGLLNRMSRLPQTINTIKHLSHKYESLFSMLAGFVFFFLQLLTCQ